MSRHEIIRQSGEYRCLTCEWSWQSKPQSECPGVPRYHWHTKPKHLSKTQLNLAGFKVREGQKPRGMVQSANGKEWWMLYDIRQSDSKKPGRSPQEGLAILQEKLARKEEREKEARLWREIDWELNLLEHHFNALTTWIGPPYPNTLSGLAVKERAIHNLIREIRLDIGKSKKALHQLYPPAQAQPGDMVLGGVPMRPQPGDAVLGRVSRK